MAASFIPPHAPATFSGRCRGGARYSLLGVLLALLLATSFGCDAVEPEAAQAQSGAHSAVLYAVVGSSNAARLYTDGRDDFIRAHVEHSPEQPFVIKIAHGGANLVQQDGPDWHPDSEGEYFDGAVTRINRAMDSLRSAFPTATFGGVIWNQGNEQRQAYYEDPAIEDEWFAAWEQLQAAFVAEVGGQFFHIVSGTDPKEERARLTGTFTREWRWRETQTCVLSPQCKLVANGTDHVFRQWVACGEDAACRQHWFRGDGVHWGDEAAEHIMTEAAHGIFLPEPDL